MWNGSLRNPAHVADAVREADKNEKAWLEDRNHWFSDILGDIKTEAKREAEYATEIADTLGISI